jgi:Zn-dependent metalloprotease
MERRARPNLALLALLTASGLLFAGEGLKPMAPVPLAALRAQEPSRALLVRNQVALQKVSLGLGMADDLVETSRFTDVYGGTHVHFQQTYRGLKVWNSHIIGSLGPDGVLKPVKASVETGIQLDPVPLIDSRTLDAVVARSLHGPGRLVSTRVEQVVFPTRFQDGVKFTRDAQGALVIDPAFSVGTPRRQDPFVWAFHVTAMLAGKGGPSAIELVVDGRTGDILRKWDGVQHDAPAGAVGTGHGQYMGGVLLDTEMVSPGTYTLRDTTRATQPWPAAAANPMYAGACAGIGNLTLYYDEAGSASGLMPFLNGTDTWGDGQPFAGALGCVNSETAGVDTHAEIQAVWDYYGKVLGRTQGLDGTGGSIVGLVHKTDYGAPWLNAAWFPALFMIQVGDGGPNGCMAGLDVMAHEMSHGVMTYTANVSGGEGDGLNESNSDCHGIMMKYWTWGEGGGGATIPAITTNAPDGDDTLHLWTIGGQVFGKDTPLRYMYKPSLDGFSYDTWFSGIGIDDSHYVCGPANRAFFFLAQGASKDATQPTYTEYLPDGMDGVGNDKAIRILYNAMATKIKDPASGYDGLRAGMIESATELFGEGSKEVAAVMSAYAGVNLGVPEGAQPAVQIAFPVTPEQARVFAIPSSFVAPAGIPVKVPVPVVTNASNTSYTISLGGISVVRPEGGKLLDDGQTFLGPVHTGGWPIKATSKADPRRFAVTQAFSVNLDCDSDTDVDACDLAAMALTYYAYSDNYPAANLYGGFYVDDICIGLFKMGFNNAFNN